MREFVGNLRHFLSARLWAWPLLTAVLGVVASTVLHDVRISDDVAWARFLWPGDASAASDMLSFVSSTTLTVLTTTISMTLIVLQVASGSFSHQLLRDFIQSRAVRGIVSVYVGVVAYSITLQRSMDADSEFVPQLAMTVSMVLIAISLATFIWYVSRVVDMVRVDAIIDGTVRQTIANIDERIAAADCPDHEPRPLVPASAHLLTSPDHGYVLSVDVAAARRWADRHGNILVIDARPGDLIIQGQAWGRWWPADGVGTAGAGGDGTGSSAGDATTHDDGDSGLRTRITRLFRGEEDTGDESGPPRLLRLDAERVSGVDFTLGIRQILDIGVRALSSGVNDNTTATHAIGQLTTVLRYLALNPVNPAVRYRDNQVAVWSANHEFGEVLRDVTTEIRRYGADDVGVCLQALRLLDIIEDAVDEPAGGPASVRRSRGYAEIGPGLDHGARVELRRFLTEERRRIVAAARRSIPDAHDVARVETAAFDRDAAHEPPPEPGV
ncbi:DUF2254 domain-containing protein [uncultured Corynebacterium sp.]|uniref:DUF2254 domain-containing protein n=1 Tax=uncultured Corynebacterium sp. TaxID=159447 RepID=UPI0025FAEA20|nr:DUF2254 family protein [uncultured Corynebacterium sp.]